MKTSKKIKLSIELSEWLGSRINGLRIPKDEKSILACSCFHLVIEHHRAILLLIDRKLYGSALALVRVLFESFIRGLWLQHCATPKELNLYANDKLELKFSDLLKNVEAVPGWDSGLFSNFKSNYWKPLNSFTHSGFLQTSQRFNGSTIVSDYSDEDIYRTVSSIGAWTILTGIAISQLADDDTLAESILEKAKAFASLNIEKPL